jgi:hypothetical protein
VAAVPSGLSLTAHQEKKTWLPDGQLEKLRLDSLQYLDIFLLSRASSTALESTELPLCLMDAGYSGERCRSVVLQAHIHLVQMLGVRGGFSYTPPYISVPSYLIKHGDSVVLLMGKTTKILSMDNLSLSQDLNPAPSAYRRRHATHSYHDILLADINMKM